MQTTGRPKTQSGYATTRSGEPPSSNLKRSVTTAAVACDHVLHGVGRSVFVLAPFVMLAVLVAGLGYVRLRHGPISLDFLVEPIEQGINAELAGNTVRIDDAIVRLSEAGGLEFRLSNIRVHEPDGDVVASAPFAAVELNTSALWSMRVVPARIELIEPRLFLFYSEQGGLALSFSKPVASAAATEPGAAPAPVAPAPLPAERSAARPIRARRRRAAKAHRPRTHLDRHVLARASGARCDFLLARVRPAQRHRACRLRRTQHGVARPRSHRRPHARPLAQRDHRPRHRRSRRRQAVGDHVRNR